MPWILGKCFKPVCSAQGAICILKWCVVMKEHSNDLQVANKPFMWNRAVITRKLLNYLDNNHKGIH